MDVQRPARLGRYEILAPIAAGGMAEVFAGRLLGEQGPPKLVAIKVMREELLAEERFVAMFVDEARVAAHIAHPNVVGIHDLGRTDHGVPYLVMDLVIGASVSQLLKGDAQLEPAPLPVALAVEIAAQAAEGLHAAHEAKDALGTPLEIVHRDVSPQNVLVGLDGYARITDFGVARAVARLTRTESGEVKGKARYFSPEQALGRSVDRRSDLWALGVVLWEVLALKPLFTGRTMGDVLQAVVSGQVPDVRQHRPDVPESVARAIGQALERAPDRRVANGLELARVLREAAHEGRVPAPRPSQIAQHVHVRSGRTIETLTEAIRARTGVAVTLPSFDDTEDTESDDGGFTDEEPTTVDHEFARRVGAKGSRPGVDRAALGGALGVTVSSKPSRLIERAESEMATIPESKPDPIIQAAVAAAIAAKQGVPLRESRGVATLPLGVMVPSESAMASAAAEVRVVSVEATPPVEARPPRSAAHMVACPRCGREVPLTSLSFADDGAKVCKICHSSEVVAEGDRGAVRTIAGMGYGALLAGFLTLCFTWVPYLNVVPAVLAIGSAVAFFVHVSRSPEHRRHMGWQLPAATIASAIGLALGLLVPITYVLVLVGLAAAR